MKNNFMGLLLCSLCSSMTINNGYSMDGNNDRSDFNNVNNANNNINNNINNDNRNNVLSDAMRQRWEWLHMHDEPNDDDNNDDWDDNVNNANNNINNNINNDNRNDNINNVLSDAKRQRWEWLHIHDEQSDYDNNDDWD